MGTTIEWYDFFAYGTATALVFPKLFFSTDLSPFIAQIAAFSTFAVGFLARPFGAALFGHIGDVFGRKIALVTALLVMGCVTTVIGLLPPYASIGAVAPLLLVVLRFVQGLAIGGQWGGAALLATESAPPGRRGFYGSFVQIGAPAGVVLANIVFLTMGTILTPGAFEAWGWRIPFLLSIVLVGIGIYIQFRFTESEEFRGAVAVKEAGGGGERNISPVLQVIASHTKEIALAGGTYVATNICFYIAITYVITYGTGTLHVSKDTMLGSITIAGIVMVPALIFCGHLSDRWGRLEIFMVGTILTGVWALLFFPLMETRSPVLIAIDLSVELILMSLMYGPQAALFAELFPVEVRYSGASLGYQLGAIFGGGFAPIIATALFEHFRSSLLVGLYMCVACAVSFMSTYWLAKPARLTSCILRQGKENG